MQKKNCAECKKDLGTDEGDNRVNSKRNNFEIEFA